MKHFFHLILLFCSLNLGAQSPSESLRAELPAGLQKLKLKESTPQDAIRALGAADLIKENSYYWKEGKFKYAIALNFKDNKLERIHYSFVTHSPLLTQYIKNPEELKYKNDHQLLYKDAAGEIIVDIPSRTIQSVSYP